MPVLVGNNLFFIATSFILIIIRTWGDRIDSRTKILFAAGQVIYCSRHHSARRTNKRQKIAKRGRILIN